jgi:hypothetical protein
MPKLATSRSAVALAIAAGLGLAACGGAAPQATTAHAAEGKAKKPALELVKGEAKLAGEIAGEADASRSTKVGTGVAFPQAQAFDRFGVPQVGSPRETVKIEPFRIADLPRADIPEPLPIAEAPTRMPEGEVATDLFVDWESAYRSNSMLGRSDSYTSVRVSLRGHHLARLRIGNNEGAVTAGAGGGVYVVCRVAEDAARRFVTARWESLGASADGGAVLSVVDAWFDMSSCKASIVRKTRVQMKSLASGIFFGYREACKECPTGERVIFVTPNPQHIAAAGVGGEATTTLGSVSRVSLPVRKGGGGSVVVRYASGVLSDWLKALGQERLPEGDVVAGIDIAQGVEEAEPIAIAYASKSTSPLAPGAKSRPRITQHVPPPPVKAAPSDGRVLKVPSPTPSMAPQPIPQVIPLNLD